MHNGISGEGELVVRQRAHETVHGMRNLLHRKSPGGDCGRGFEATSGAGARCQACEYPNDHRGCIWKGGRRRHGRLPGEP
jgi:hypothetical protein